MLHSQRHQVLKEDFESLGDYHIWYYLFRDLTYQLKILMLSQKFLNSLNSVSYQNTWRNLLNVDEVAIKFFLVCIAVARKMLSYLEAWMNRYHRLLLNLVFFLWEMPLIHNTRVWALEIVEWKVMKTSILWCHHLN